jgi:hypothetical protein
MTQHARLYEGPPKGSTEVALLKLQWTTSGNYARIESMDGKPVEKGRVFKLNIQEAELLPGQHTLEVSFFSDNVHSAGSIPLTFTCKAGGVYELHVAPIDEGFGNALAEAAGGHGNWTAWIVDAETNEVLAGIPRTTKLRWYEK